MAVLRAYFDASFSMPPDVTSVGGYIGTEDQWNQTQASWMANLREWGLDYFHLAELPKVLGHEKGGLCAASFASIIKKSNLFGISAGVLNADFEAFWKRPNKIGHLEPYHLALEIAHELVGEYVVGYNPGNQVHIIIDNDKPPSTAPLAIFEYFRSVRSSRNIFSEITIGSQKDFWALQCADLAAGLWRKRWIEGIFEGKSKSLTTIATDINSLADQSLSAFWTNETAGGTGLLATRSLVVPLKFSRVASSHKNDADRG